VTQHINPVYEMQKQKGNEHKLHSLSLVQLLCPLLVKLFPNCTRIHVITYTYCNTSAYYEQWVSVGNGFSSHVHIPIYTGVMWTPGLSESLKWFEYHLLSFSRTIYQFP